MAGPTYGQPLSIPQGLSGLMALQVTGPRQRGEARVEPLVPGPLGELEGPRNPMSLLDPLQATECKGNVLFFTQC